jgi:hypothetical protein
MAPEIPSMNRCAKSHRDLIFVPWAVVGHLVGSSAIGVGVTGVGSPYISEHTGEAV